MTSSVAVVKISNWLDAQPKLGKFKQIILQAFIDDDLELEELFDFSAQDLKEFCQENKFRVTCRNKFIKAVEQYNNNGNKFEVEGERGEVGSEGEAETNNVFRNVMETPIDESNDNNNASQPQPAPQIQIQVFNESKKNDNYDDENENANAINSKESGINNHNEASDSESESESNSNNNSNSTESKIDDADDDNSERAQQIKRQLEKFRAEYLRKQKNQNTKLLKSASQIFECNHKSSNNNNNNNSDINTELHVKVNDPVFDLLDNTIPIVTIMGPSRQGKSTLINDMMGVQNMCRVSNIANKAETNGAWICLYVHPQTKKPLFYLIDAEGLSHDVTEFTQRLFYLCYAISNVIIWNDKSVGDKQFDECMDKIYSRMTLISRSDQKPSFIYLQRDAGFFDYDECADFNNYIQESDTFSYLRDMNIFSSLNGYELDRRPGRKTPFSQKDMSLLTDFIVNICSNSTRFMTNLVDSKPQIQEINYSLRLSLEVKLLCEHPILKYFYYGIDDGSDGYRANKLIKMTCFAVSQDWKHAQIKSEFEKGFYQFRWTVKTNNDIVLDDEMTALLTANQQELYQRVKNKVHKMQSSAMEEANKLSPLEAMGVAVTAAVAAVSGVVVGILISPALVAGSLILGMGAPAYLTNYKLGPTDDEKAKAKPNKKNLITRLIS